MLILCICFELSIFLQYSVSFFRQYLFKIVRFGYEISVFNTQRFFFSVSIYLKLSRFGYEISVFNTQQGGIQNSRRSIRLIHHGNDTMEEWMSKFF